MSTRIRNTPIGICVITGAPSAGKSTLLGKLESRGYLVVPEAARELIDEGIARDKPIEEIRRNEAQFQKEVLLRNLRREITLPIDRDVLLDRAIPDSIAFYLLQGPDPNHIRQQALGRYRRIFFRSG